MGLKVGDEVTISGTVIEIKDGICGQQAVVCTEEGRVWSLTGPEAQNGVMSGVINLQY